MDAKKILTKLRGEADRESKTLYLSKTLFKEFEVACGDIAPSRVIEEMMREFIESGKDQKKIKAKAQKH